MKKGISSLLTLLIILVAVSSASANSLIETHDGEEGFNNK